MPTFTVKRRVFDALFGIHPGPVVGSLVEWPFRTGKARKVLSVTDTGDVVLGDVVR